MATKSPTVSIKSREIIGVSQFSQRREIFDKHNTVFLPPLSPTTTTHAYRELEPIITSNHGKTTVNFKRNTLGTSSMREPKTEDFGVEIRSRKYSGNFTSELNQGDDVDYRSSMTERSRRLSRLRREFLNSNLHEPNSTSPFSRSGTRCSLPAKSTTLTYKIESPNLHKFPFAEPFTPPPARKVMPNIQKQSSESECKENEDPEVRLRVQSFQQDSSPTRDHQKLFEELVKRYSPQRKPIDWELPPTRPRVVGSVAKSSSSMEKKPSIEENNNKPGDDDVFYKKEDDETDTSIPKLKLEEEIKNTQIVHNGPEVVIRETVITRESDDSNRERDSKISTTELAERNDKVLELVSVQTPNNIEPTRKVSEHTLDMNIPALIEKINAEGNDLEKHKNDVKKVKRKRSFLDKLLGRNKDKAKK